MKPIFNQNEIQLIIEKYSDIGPRGLSEIINKTPKQIESKRHLLVSQGHQIKDYRKSNNARAQKSKHFKYIKNISNDKRSVDPDKFINCVTPESAYLLGLIWGDGSISCGPKNYRLSIKMVTEDISTLDWIFNFLGEWRTYGAIPKKYKSKHQTTYYVGNKPLVEFLASKGYRTKSFESANLILNHIPKNLHSYWFRGLFDSDGCLSVSSKGQWKFIITSGYEQNWDFLEKQCDELDINYKIYRTDKHYKNSYSHNSNFIILRQHDVGKFCRFIYHDMDIKLMGLKRKYDKFIKMLNSK